MLHPIARRSARTNANLGEIWSADGASGFAIFAASPGFFRVEIPNVALSDAVIRSLLRTAPAIRRISTSASSRASSFRGVESFGDDRFPVTRTRYAVILGVGEVCRNVV